MLLVTHLGYYLVQSTANIIAILNTVLYMEVERIQKHKVSILVRKTDMHKDDF